MVPTSVVPSYDMRKRIVGVDQLAPLLDGRQIPYVNLDNAASTPALTDVMDAVQRFIPYYASVHRGTGFKSRLSTVAYDQAHEIVGRFVGADLSSNTVIFGKNTTEAINKLSFRLPCPPELGHPYHAARTPLQRPALACAPPGRARAGYARGPAGRGGFRLQAAPVRRPDRFGDGHRRHPMSAGSSSRSIAWRARRTPPAPRFWWTPRSLPRTARST